ncbi:MAG: hypothetical protein LBQ31_09505 [Bacteroidales bacterium]|jgi:hypothetical protein|nr:hypothetical protein [Bacteroidales bacterium]
MKLSDLLKEFRKKAVKTGKNVKRASKTLIRRILPVQSAKMVAIRKINKKPFVSLKKLVDNKGQMYVGFVKSNPATLDKKKKTPPSHKILAPAK